MIRVIADTRNAKQHWERRNNPLPYLMVPMSNGDTVRYNPEIKQPAPVLKDGLDKFTETCVGYEKTGDAATSTGQVTKVHRGHCTTEREDK